MKNISGNDLDIVFNVADDARERIFWMYMMLINLKDDGDYCKSDFNGIAHVLDGIYMDLEPAIKYLSNLVEKDSK